MTQARSAAAKASAKRAKRRAAPARPKVAVIAHSGKTFGGGLSELLGALVAAGVSDPLWFEVDKSRKAPKRVKKALQQGATLVFVWGGDGMVQRCIDVLAKSKAGSKTAIAILPAGTANLLASNLGIPKDIPQCVDIGLHGNRRHIDLGQVNGERFAVMAGVGLDALMIQAADKGLKSRFGRLAYLWTGSKQVDAPLVGVQVKVDGKDWFEGRVSCLLFGNVGTAFAGVTLFEDTKLDDGRLDFAVVTAKGFAEWTRTVARTLSHQQDTSPFIQMGSGRKIKVVLDRPMPYELDGSVRPPTDQLKVKVHPGAVTVCVPPGRPPDGLA